MRPTFFGVANFDTSDKPWMTPAIGRFFSSAEHKKVLFSASEVVKYFGNQLLRRRSHA
jgi:hypothetical protein